jgi:hypothetical protein
VEPKRPTYLIIYEDMKRNPESVWKNLEKFLGISSNNATNLTTPADASSVKRTKLRKLTRSNAPSNAQEEKRKQTLLEQPLRPKLQTKLRRPQREAREDPRVEDENEVSQGAEQETEMPTGKTRKRTAKPDEDKGETVRPKRKYTRRKPNNGNVSRWQLVVR